MELTLKPFLQKKNKFANSYQKYKGDSEFFTKFYEWAFPIAEKDRIRNFDKKKEFSALVLKEAILDLENNRALLNAYKHGFAIWSEAAAENSQLFDARVVYLHKTGKIIRQMTLDFAIQRVVNKAMLLAGILPNMQKAWLSDGIPIDVVSFQVSDEQIQLFRTMRREKKTTAVFYP